MRTLYWIFTSNSIPASTTLTFFCRPRTPAVLRFAKIRQSWPVAGLYVHSFIVAHEEFVDPKEFPAEKFSERCLLGMMPELRELFPTRVILPSEQVSIGLVNDATREVDVSVQWEWEELDP